MKSETAKLPKGQSYPLRPYVLSTALADAGVEIDTYLVRSPGSLSDAHFWPPNENVPFERLYVRTGSVPYQELAVARQWMENIAVPKLAEWVVGILSGDKMSPVRREVQWLSLDRL